MEIEKLMEGLPEDRQAIIKYLCANFMNQYDETPKEQRYSFCIEYYALYLALADKYELIVFPEDSFTGTEEDDSDIIYDHFREEMSRVGLDNLHNTIDKLTFQYKAQMRDGFYYSFSENNISQIQKVINELREIFTKSEYLEERHKSRLLMRLEALQRELHKHMSDLDKFWGLVGDAGVAMGKLGKDSKPIVDRIREITKIIWQVQSRAEGLPDDSPNLIDSNDSL